MRKYNISFKEGDERRKNLLLVRRKPEQQKRKLRGWGGGGQTETERARETQKQRRTESHGDGEEVEYLFISGKIQRPFLKQSTFGTRRPMITHL